MAKAIVTAGVSADSTKAAVTVSEAQKAVSLLCCRTLSAEAERMERVSFFTGVGSFQMRPC